MSGPGAAVQAAVIVDELARGGVGEVVLAPGSRSAPLVLAAEAHPDVRTHARVDERSAAFTALGLARATGRPAAALCTSGTAAASFHPAVLEADAAGVPLVALTADRPPALRDVGANQTVAQRGLYGQAVRAHADLLPADDPAAATRAWRSEVGRLLAAARGAGAGVPGPVQLNAAFAEPLVADEPAVALAPGGRDDQRPWTAARPGPALPDDADLADLARRVGGVSRGVIVAGEGTVPAGRGLAPPGWPDDPGRGGAAVSDLAERLGWPVLAEPTSQARRPGTAVDCADAVLRAEAFLAEHEPDLVLRLGRAVLGRPLARWLAETGAAQVVVTSGGRWHDPPRTAERIVVGEPDRVCAALAARLDPPDPLAALDADDDADSWTQRWHAAGRAARAAVDARLDAEDALGEARLARDLLAALPSEAVLVAGSSRPVRDLDEVAAPRGDVVVLGNRGASGIDGFCSTAVGVALGTRRPVVALSGDLALLHDASALALLDSPAPDLTVVVVDNDGGGIFAQLPPGRLPDPLRRRFTTPHGVDLAALAAAFGVASADVRAAGELPAALAAAASRGGLQLLRVPTDADATATAWQRLRTEAAAAVDALATGGG